MNFGYVDYERWSHRPALWVAGITGFGRRPCGDSRAGSARDDSPTRPRVTP